MKPLLATLVLVASVVQAQETKVVVLNARVDSKARASLGKTIAELVIDALGRVPGRRVVGEADIAPFLDEGARKQLSSCDDDTACMVEVGGSIGADWFVAPAALLIGTQFHLTMRLLDAKGGRIVSRESVQVPADEDGLAAAVCPLVQQLLVSAATKGLPVVNGCSGAAPPPAPAPVAPGAPARQRELWDPPIRAVDLNVDPKAAAYAERALRVEKGVMRLPDGRTSGKGVKVYSVRSQLPITQADLFYRLDRPDLTKAMIENDRQRSQRVWIGLGILVGGLTLAGASFATAPAATDRNFIFSASTHYTAGTVLSLTALTVGFGYMLCGGPPATTLSDDETVKLVEDYNARIRREIDAGIVPTSSRP